MNHKKRINGILLGDSGVGKTSLLNNLINKKYNNKTTIVVDFEFLDYKDSKILFWDTNGNKIFTKMLRPYVKNSNFGIILINQQSEIKNIEYWINFYLDYSSFKNIIIFNNSNNNIDVNILKNNYEFYYTSSEKELINLIYNLKIKRKEKNKDCRICGFNCFL